MPLVVIGLEVGDPDFGVEQGDPLVHVQAFVADSIVERLDELVSPWLAGRDVWDPDLVLAEFSEGIRDEFGAVVAADQHRQTTHRNNKLEYSNLHATHDAPVSC